MSVTRPPARAEGGGGKHFKPQEVLKSLTENTIITGFFKWEREVSLPDKIPYKQIVRDLVFSKDPTARNLVCGVMAMPASDVKNRAREILAGFNAKPTYRQYEKAGSFGKLAAIKTMGKYDLSEFFSHSLGAAPFGLEMLKRGLDLDECFTTAIKDGLTALRAIALESEGK